MSLKNKTLKIIKNNVPIPIKEKKDLKNTSESTNFEVYNVALLMHYIFKKKIPVVVHNGMFDFLYVY